MSETLKKKPFPWRKYVLVMVGLALVGRIVWLTPRTSWSLKDSGRADFSQQNVRQAGLRLKDVGGVVIISIDTCRADHLGCYGYSRKTSPNIDAFAAEGILFNHAVTPIPTTLPSHASMLTGTVPLYHGVRDNDNYRLAASNVTLAEILQENGFKTGAVIGAFVLDSQFGLDQGFDTYEDEMGQVEKKVLLHNERDAKEGTRLALAWLQEHYKDKFFLFLHYFDPHTPYRFHKEFAFSSLPVFVFSKDRYDSEIAYTDRCIGRVLDMLKSLDLYDTTLIIVTGDHGEGLGQHGEDTHSYFIYHSTLHVPMIIRIPGSPEGIIINETVGLIDVVPTVCGVLGIPVQANVQGENLCGLFSGNTDSFKNRAIYCEALQPTKFGLDPLLGLVSGRWKYIHTSNPELYDLKDDPHESRNLISQNIQQAGVMQAQLKTILQNANITDPVDSKMAIDAETRNRLESLGYLASQTVDDNVQFEQNGRAPKDFVEFCKFAGKFPELLHAGKSDKARKLCNDILKKWPNMPQFYYYLGLVAVGKKDFESTITHFSRYLAMMESESNDGSMHARSDYQLAIAYGNLGSIFDYKGDVEKAKENLKKALIYNPYEIEYIRRLADVYYKSGVFNDAITYYTKALDIEPNSPEVHYYLGNVLFQQGKVEEAAAHYKSALRLRPGWPEAIRNLRVALAQMNQREGLKP